MFATIRTDLMDWGKRAFARLSFPIARTVEDADNRLVAVGWLGVIGFPLFYVIWGYWLPESYENPLLRAIGAFMAAPFIFIRRWPQRYRRWLPLIWYLGLLYVLPFFFTFMTLKNDMSQTWVMSSLIALFLLILVVDWLNLIVLYVVGVGMAWLAYHLTTVNPLPLAAFIDYLPIFGFAVVAGVVFSVTEEIITEEKRKAMLAVGAIIAHELRTPLLSIRSAGEGLGRFLPRLLSAYRVAREAGLPVEEMRERHLHGMEEVLRRLVNEVEYSNTVIDMLLANAGSARVDMEKAAPHSMQATVEAALDRFPFNPESQRDRVRVRVLDDFPYQGFDALMVHVIFNLLRNSLAAIERKGSGAVLITIGRGAGLGRLLVHDTGSGIPDLVRPHLFKPFTSFSETGTGLGLAFCRRVVESFGGEISVDSVEGEFTEFKVTLPEVEIDQNE